MNVKENISTLQSFMNDYQIDWFFVSAQDSFLNEYTPMEDCHRYYYSGFSGSTGVLLIPKNGKVKLFIDGRYFEQADLEVDQSLVENVQCDMSRSLEDHVLDFLKKKKNDHIAFEGDRISLNLAKKFQKKHFVTSFSQGEIAAFLEKNLSHEKVSINYLKPEFRGESVEKRIKKLGLKNGEAQFLSALDQVAWFSNLRSFQLPFMSSFKSKALVTRDGLFVFLDSCLSLEGNEDFEDGLVVFTNSLERLNEELINVFKVEEIKKVYIDESTINYSDFEFLDSTKVKVLSAKTKIVELQCKKTEKEKEFFRNSFLKSSKAIFKTISWAKDNDSLTEGDLDQKIEEEYKNQGALGLSFHSIAGLGANSSIIHYHANSFDVKLSEGHLGLLDSGAYYEEGYATDCTRSFVLSKSEKVDEKAIEIYTLVLKSVLNLQNFEFKEGTLGKKVDAVARKPIEENGYFYNHGTGHGIGLNVHEGGVRLSTVSEIPMKEGQVVSLEPGIYIPGFGGVRLENVAIVKKKKKKLCFENIVFVGFDHQLINYDLLTKKELKWLIDYESKCLERENSFIGKEGLSRLQSRLQ